MAKKTHVWCRLAIYSLSILMLAGIGSINLNSVSANCSHVQITRVNQRVHKNHDQNYRRVMAQKASHQRRVQQVKQRIQRHKRNVQRYQHLKRRHRINQRRIKQRKRNHKRSQSHYRYNQDVVRNRNYDFYKNYELDVDTVKPRNSYHEIMGNDKVTFNHPIYLHYTKYVHNNYGYKNGDPQSIAILPNGNLYVLFNAGHGDSHLNRIFKYDIKNGKLLKVGRTFKGGHGQGLSYDYRTNQLWMCLNKYRYKGYPRGILPKVLIITKINQKTLKPYGRHIDVHSRDALGEDFTYDKSGDYWNVARSYKKHNRNAPLDSLQIYQGENGKLRLMRDLLNSPSACIQNLAYNPNNNRLYVVGNGVILSFPANQIHHLNNHKIKVSVMNHHSEFEDIGFWRNRAYLLVHPDRILRSNRAF